MTGGTIASAPLLFAGHRRPGSVADPARALIGLALVVAIGLIWPGAGGAFYAARTHADALWQIAATGVLACGMTVVILTGGIDLSVASIAALSGVIFAKLTMHAGWAQGFAAVAAAALAVVSGLAAGLLSGVLIGYAHLQPFVATLAMMAFARGLAKSSWVSGGVKITAFPPPPCMESLASRIPVLGVEVSIGVFVFAACVAATAAALRFTAPGRWVYAVGDNPDAAHYSGINVPRVRTAAYALSGALSGLAGVMLASTERQGNPDGYVGYELSAIAMVVMGGTALRGGRGGALLTLIGAMTIGYLAKVLDLNGVDTPFKLMTTGVIIVVAVASGSRGAGRTTAARADTL